MNNTSITVNGRTADHPIDPLFLERWSPRAFTGEAISEGEFMTILEAARWAPSSYNSQPWRFLYALRDAPHWERFLGLLGDFNRTWAQHASALVVIVSNSVMRPPGAEHDVPSYSHSFDAGAAWAHLALQAVRSGWYAHGMVGFDKERAFAELNVPAGYRVEAAVAIGRRGDAASLSEALRAREAPNDREPLAVTALEGGFPGA
jgi:nitroreductase